MLNRIKLKTAVAHTKAQRSQRNSDTFKQKTAVAKAVFLCVLCG